MHCQVLFIVPRSASKETPTHHDLACMWRACRSSQSLAMNPDTLTSSAMHPDTPCAEVRSTNMGASASPPLGFTWRPEAQKLKASADSHNQQPSSSESVLLPPTTQQPLRDRSHYRRDEPCHNHHCGQYHQERSSRIITIIMIMFVTIVACCRCNQRHTSNS